MGNILPLSEEKIQAIEVDMEEYLFIVEDTVRRYVDERMGWYLHMVKLLEPYLRIPACTPFDKMTPQQRMTIQDCMSAIMHVWTMGQIKEETLKKAMRAVMKYLKGMDVNLARFHVALETSLRNVEKAFPDAVNLCIKKLEEGLTLYKESIEENITGNVQEMINKSTAEMKGIHGVSSHKLDQVLKNQEESSSSSAKLQKLIEKLETKLDTTNNTEELQRRVMQLELENAGLLQAKHEEIQQHKAPLEIKIVELTKEKEDTQRRIDQVEAENGRLIKKNEDAEQEITQLKEEMARMKEKYQKLHREASDHLNSFDD